MSAGNRARPADARSSRSEGRARWFVALGAALIALLAGEIVTRVAFESLVDSGQLASEQAEQRFWRHRVRSDDDLLYYELRPDLTMNFGGVPVRTNSEGRRVPDQPTPAAPRPAGDPLRLALIGDSSSFGWKVTYADSYAEVVRARLESAWQRPVELINYSVPGYNAEQELRLLETDVLPWQPDLILWHYDHNDADAILAFNEPLVLPPAWGDNVFGSALVKVLRRKLQLGRLSERLLQTEAHERLGGYIREGPLYDRQLAALRQADQLATRAGIPVLLILFDADVRPPGRHDGHFEILHTGLLEVLAPLGFTVLDLYPSYRAELASRGWDDLSAWWLAPDDQHPNPEGHAFIGDQVVETVLATAGLTPR